MQRSLDSHAKEIELLKSFELEKTVENIFSIICTFTEPKAIAVLLWDSDLDSFADKLAFGSRAEGLLALVQNWTSLKPGWGLDLNSTGLLSLPGLPSELQPLLAYKVDYRSTLQAIILIGGSSGLSPSDLKSQLDRYALASALH